MTAFPSFAAAGAFSFAEFLHLKTVYDTLSAESWFVASRRNHLALASVILNAYRTGLYDDQQLLTVCRMKAFDAMEAPHDRI